MPCSPGHFDHDLAARMTALDRPQRVAGLLKRKCLRDERVQCAVHDEPGHRVEHGPVPGARDRRAAQFRDRAAVSGRYQLGPVRQQARDFLQGRAADQVVNRVDTIWGGGPDPVRRTLARARYR